MVDDGELRAKLAKVERCSGGPAVRGAQAAAGAAMDRLHAGLGSSDRDREPEAELTFSLVDAEPAGYCSRHKKKPSDAS